LSAHAEPAHYDPFDYSHHEDPYAVYRRLRDESPVYRSERYGFYALSRYADCLGALRNHRVFSSAEGTSLEPLKAQVPTLLNSDPPVHTRLRKLLSERFLPPAVAPLEQAVRDLARELLEPHAHSGRLDVIADFAAKLPMAIICRLLGFARGDEDRLRSWTDTVVHRDEGVFEMPEAGRQATLDLYAYFEAELRRRTGQPSRGDLVATLLDAEAAGRLTHDELLGYVYILSIAGNETTTKLIGNIVYQLHRHPEQKTAVLGDRALVAGAVEETMRYDGPTQMMARTTTAAIDLHGATIPAGARVALLFVSANRDERKFANAETFDVRRGSRDHLGFGGGLHACLGAALARLEARVAIEELLRVAPDFALEESGLERMHSPQVRGYTHVPVTFTPRRGGRRPERPPRWQ
jgi:cytochrome P450